MLEQFHSPGSGLGIFLDTQLDEVLPPLVQGLHCPQDRLLFDGRAGMAVSIAQHVQVQHLGVWRAREKDVITVRGKKVQRPCVMSRDAVKSLQPIKNSQKKQKPCTKVSRLVIKTPCKFP